MKKSEYLREYRESAKLIHSLKAQQRNSIDKKVKQIISSMVKHPDALADGAVDAILDGVN